MFCHGFDEGVESFSDYIDMIVCCWVVFLIADNRSTECNGGVDL